MGRYIGGCFAVGKRKKRESDSGINPQAPQSRQGEQAGCQRSNNRHWDVGCGLRGVTAPSVTATNATTRLATARSAKEWRARGNLGIWPIRGWFFGHRAGLQVAAGALSLIVWLAVLLAAPPAMAMGFNAIAGKSVLVRSKLEMGTVDLIKHGRRGSEKGKESRGRNSRDANANRGNRGNRGGRGDRGEEGKRGDRAEKDARGKGKSSGKKDSARGKQRSGKKSGHRSGRNKSGNKSKADRHARANKSRDHHKSGKHKSGKHKSDKHKSGKHKSDKHKSHKQRSKRVTRVIKSKKKVHKVVKVTRIVRAKKVKKSFHKHKKKVHKVVKVKKVTKVKKTRKIVGKHKKKAVKIVKVKKVTKVKKIRKVVGKRKKVTRKIVKVKKVKKVFKTIRLKRKGRHKRRSRKPVDHTVTHSTPVAAPGNGAGSAATADENLRCVKISGTGSIHRAVHPRIRNGRGACPGGYEQLRLFNRGWHATLPESYGDEQFVLQFTDGEVQLMRVE